MTQMTLPLATERKKKPTQCDMIREHLESGHTITALDALDLYGCFRLAARIGELENDGMQIASRYVQTPRGATIKEYCKRGGSDE